MTPEELTELTGTDLQDETLAAFLGHINDRAEELGMGYALRRVDVGGQTFYEAHPDLASRLEELAL